MVYDDENEEKQNLRNFIKGLDLSYKFMYWWKLSTSKKFLHICVKDQFHHPLLHSVDTLISSLSNKIENTFYDSYYDFKSKKWNIFSKRSCRKLNVWPRGFIIFITSLEVYQQREREVQLHFHSWWL